MHQVETHFRGWRLTPGRIVVIYVLSGIAWITCSDTLVARIVGDVGEFRMIAMGKGMLFVILTALMVYLLVKRYVRDIHRSHVRFRTAQARAEQEIEQLIHYDQETGLPNQHLLMDRLNQVLALASRERRRTAVIYVSLIGYKGIVDTLGHQGSNRVMGAIARQLTGSLRQYDTVARIHRDEFAIVLGGSVQEGDITVILGKLQQLFAMPLPLEEGECAIPACIGVACFPSDGLTGDILLQNAHIAMNQARQRGVSTQFFSESMNRKAVERYGIEAGMLRAIDDGEFFLCYQPKIDLATAAATGMEALVRWRRPGTGIVSPDKFIPVAEENGMIVRLGSWVLREACRQNRAWQDAGLPAISVSVNISARQLRENSFVDQVLQTLRDTGLEPRHLELELTETAVMADSDDTVQKLLQLKRAGIAVSVDDFGTGYSSLSYLKHLPLDTIKVDRAFVRDITSDTDDAAIVEAVIAIAHALKLNVVAEGVETAEQLTFLRDRRCQSAQGYLFSRPLEATAFEEFLRGTLPAGQPPTTPAATPDPPERPSDSGQRPAMTVEVLGDISQKIVPAAPADNLTGVLKRFQIEKELRVLPVVEHGRVAGILNRSTFLEEHVIGMHGFAFHINHNKKLRDLMSPVPLALEATTPIREAARLIQSREAGMRIDNVCVTRQGLYEGVLDINRFVSAITEINLTLAKGANPLTGLPGNESIQREISTRLASGRPFDIAYVDIDNFKPFNDHYGFQRGDVVIKALGEIMLQVAGEADSPIFCGHIGGDDFILITGPHRAESLSRNVIARFQVQRPLFHTPADLATGGYTTLNRKGEVETFPLISLSIGIVDTELTPVTSYAQLASIASDVKKAAKQLGGSSVVVNKRRGNGQREDIPSAVQPYATITPAPQPLSGGGP